MLFKIGQALPFLWESKSKHRIHSPFVFQYLTQLLGKGFPHPPVYTELSQLAKEWKQNHTEIEVVDYGAKGNRQGVVRKQKVSSIFKRAVSNPHKLALIAHSSRYGGATKMLECGTSLGYSSVYFANFFNAYVGIEAAPSLAQHTRKTLAELGLTGRVEEVKIEEKLPGILSNLEGEDWVIYLDGNHTLFGLLHQLELLLPYLEKIKVVVVDDIRWSREMFEGWTLVRENKAFSISFDLFQMGILFNRQGVRKQHFPLFHKQILKLATSG